jgi:uncharacterized protein YkwD
MTLAQRVRTLSISLLMAAVIGGCIASAHTEQLGQVSSVAETEDVATQGVQTATPFDIEAVRQEIIRGANEERAKVGLSPLRVDSTLMEVAQERAHEISANFDHRGPDGERLAAIKAEERGYQGQVGENIGLVRSSFTAQAAMRMWCSSEGHYQNMTDGRYASTGVGAVFVPFNGLYLVQVFGTQ